VSVVAGVFEYPSSDLRDLASLFGERDENVPRYEASIRVMPREQRFDGSDPPIGSTNNGLVFESKFLPL
jgi:hypothetical protein